MIGCLISTLHDIINFLNYDTDTHSSIDQVCSEGSSIIIMVNYDTWIRDFWWSNHDDDDCGFILFGDRPTCSR